MSFWLRSEYAKDKKQDKETLEIDAKVIDTEVDETEETKETDETNKTEEAK